MRTFVLFAALLVPSAVAQAPADPMPRVRSVALGAQRSSDPGVSWTTAFTAANASGIARPTGVDGAPGGELCALSLETLGSTTRRAVVRRYSASGTQRWAHAVDVWGQTAEPYEVTADGATCLASALFRGNGLNGVGVARVDAGGPVFATRLDVPSRPERAFVRSDGAGGAWLGIGGDAVGDVVVRVDAVGQEAARVQTADGAETFPRGVRDFAVTADGRAVSTSTGSGVLVIAPDGTVEADAGTSSAPDPISLALDGVGGAFVLGVTPPGGAGDRSVRRYALDGTVTWTRTLGLSSANDTERPHTLVAVGGDAVVLWTDGNAPTATRLVGATGSAVWSQALGPLAYRPVEVVIAGDAVVVQLDGFEPELVALDAASGALRWSVPSGPENFWAPTWRALAVCGTGTCIQANPAPEERDRVVVTARDATVGAVAWTAERVGTPTASRRLTDIATVEGGGVVAAGTTAGEEGTTEILAVRLDDQGGVVWSVALDAGDVFNAPFANGGVASLADGGAIVAGNTFRSSQPAAFAARLAPDGALVWLSEAEPPSPETRARGEAVVALADGGALLATTETLLNPPTFTGALTRFAPDGATVWRTGLGSDRYPFALFATGGGSAVVTVDGTDLTSLAFEVARLGADGTLAPVSRFEPTCALTTPTGPIPSGIDADGVITLALTDPCDGPALIRFAPDGTVTRRTAGAPDASVSALSVDAGGDAVLAYVGGFDQSGLVRVETDGGVVWDSGLTVLGAAPSVAAQPGGGAVSVRIAPGDDRFDVPSVLLTTPSGGQTTLELPSPAGLPVSRREPVRVVLSGDGDAYLLVNGSIEGESSPAVPSVSRLSGLFVAAEAPPIDVPGLLRLVGPNPLSPGAPLRLALGAPAAIEMIDVRGRRLAQWDPGAGEHALALPALPGGLYLVRARFEDTSETVRVVVR